MCLYTRPNKTQQQTTATATTATTTTTINNNTDNRTTDDNMYTFVDYEDGPAPLPAEHHRLQRRDERGLRHGIYIYIYIYVYL